MRDLEPNEPRVRDLRCDFCGVVVWFSFFLQGPGHYDTNHLGMTATKIRSGILKHGTSSFVNSAPRSEMAMSLVATGGAVHVCVCGVIV